MAFGTGTRQWVRGTLAKIAASTVVLGSGELLIDENGGVYGGDGVTTVKNLVRLARLSEVDTRIQAVVGAAPAALDTLVEIATQLQSDETAAAAIAGRLTTAEANISANAAAIAGAYSGGTVA